MIVNTELEQKGNQFPSQITQYNKTKDTFTFHTTNGVSLKVTILRDSVFRFRYATEDGFPKDFSYAVSEKAVHGYNQLEYTEKDSHFEIKTSKLLLKINKENLTRPYMTWRAR